jgi:hypothetical protein
VQTGILYLYGAGWQVAEENVVTDGNVLHICKDAYPQ